MLAYILAQASALPDPKSYEMMGWLMAGIAALAVTVNQVLGAWHKVNPPPTPPNHEVYATKSELTKLEADHEKEMKRIEDRFEAWLEQNETHHREELKVLREWKDSMTSWQVDLAGSMGKLQALFERSVKK